MKAANLTEVKYFFDFFKINFLRRYFESQITVAFEKNTNALQKLHSQNIDSRQQFSQSVVETTWPKIIGLSQERSLVDFCCVRGTGEKSEISFEVGLADSLAKTTNGVSSLWRRRCAGELDQT